MNDDFRQALEEAYRAGAREAADWVKEHGARPGADDLDEMAAEWVRAEYEDED